jgi:hypothetical protein
MTMLTYSTVRDFKLLDIIDGLHRATITLADLEAGTPPHTLGLAPAAAAISAAIEMLTDFRLALHGERELQRIPRPAGCRHLTREKS